MLELPRRAVWKQVLRGAMVDQRANRHKEISRDRFASQKGLFIFLLSSLILWSYISNIHSILFIIILYAHNIGRWRHDSLGCENIVTTTYLHTHRIIFIKKKHIFRKFLLSLYFSSPFSLPFVFHLILTWPVQAVLYFVLNCMSGIGIYQLLGKKERHLLIALSVHLSVT